MSVTKKIVFALLVGAALFSGNARKLLSIASNAVESEAFACKESCGGSCD